MSEPRQVGLDDLKRILVDRVGLPEDDIPDDLSTTFDEIGLDSLAVMEVALAVEQEYGFQVADEDAERITTFGEALDYVNQRLAEEASA